MIVGVGRWVVWVPIRLWWAISSDRRSVLWIFFLLGFFFCWMLVSILLLSGRPKARLMMVVVWVVLRDNNVKRNEYFIE